jgi:hypothetical protein
MMLWFSLFSTFLFFFLRFLLNPLFNKISLSILKVKHVEIQEKINTYLFKLLYIIPVTIYAFYILQDIEWPYGNIEQLYDVNYEIPNNLYLYYIIITGYRTSSLIFQLEYRKRDDFKEMMIHHLCALFLVIISYNYNYVRVGLIVNYIHDVSEIPIYLGRILLKTKNTLLILINYFAILFSYFYYRIYMFVFYVIYPTYIYSSKVGKYKSQYFLISFGILELLHIYWYFMILYMGYRIIFKNNREDVQQKN